MRERAAASRRRRHKLIVILHYYSVAIIIIIPCGMVVSQAAEYPVRCGHPSRGAWDAPERTPTRADGDDLGRSGSPVALSGFDAKELSRRCTEHGLLGYGLLTLYAPGLGTALPRLHRPLGSPFATSAPGLPATFARGLGSHPCQICPGIGAPLCDKACGNCRDMLRPAKTQSHGMEDMLGIACWEGKLGV